ncbi:MAG: TIGR02253 family HAD-type hydrolase [Bacteroidetes bacterium]|nr:TIGR02253 family HAD-type hydrolase [Bacteroidota bacterium]
MIRAVIFDLDNTLVDFMAMKKRAITSAAEAMIDAGLNLSKDDIVQRIWKIYDERGFEHQRVFDDLLENLFGQINHKILASGIVAYRQAREASLVTYPHVSSTLMTLTKNGFKLAVVSDAPTREAWLRLCYLKLHHTFDAVVTFEDTHQKKPHPAPFQKALSLMETAPDEAIMLGDWAERDVLGAKLLGMKTVFARYGDVFDTIEHGADYEISDITELLGVLDKENNADK